MNAVIGILHYARSFKQGIAKEEIVVFTYMRNLLPLRLRNRQMGNSRAPKLTPKQNQKQKERLNLKEKPKLNRKRKDTT